MSIIRCRYFEPLKTSKENCRLEFDSNRKRVQHEKSAHCYFHGKRLNTAKNIDMKG